MYVYIYIYTHIYIYMYVYVTQECLQKTRIRSTIAPERREISLKKNVFSEKNISLKEMKCKHNNACRRREFEAP